MGFTDFLLKFWEAILLPYVIYALADLFLDGIEAVRLFPETCHVLLWMLLGGRSHRRYPRRPARNADPGDGSSLLPEAEDEGVVIVRRVLLGRKGEQDCWLDAVTARQIVADSFRVEFYRSVQYLIRRVVGRVLPPTLPLGRQRLPPQWPNHYKTLRHRRTLDSLGGSNSSPGYSSHYSSAVPSTTETESQSAVKARRPVVYRKIASHHAEGKTARGTASVVATISEDHVLSYEGTRQKVLVMDLDETLCHVSTTTDMMITGPTFTEVIPSSTSGGGDMFHVWVRPHAQTFLRTMSRLYNLVLFTSATQPYADTVLRHIDPDNLLKDRFYRHHCKRTSRGKLAQLLAKESQRRREATLGRGWTSATEGDDGAMSDTSTVRNLSLARPAAATAASATAVTGEAKPPFDDKAEVIVKDLRSLQVPPELLVMIDNLEECTLCNRDNALIIAPYIPHRDRYEGGVDDDDVLLGLIPFLESLLVVPDVRTVLSHGKVFS